MSILFVSVALLPDEVVNWHRTGGMWQRSWRNVGGKLILTDRRLIFSPHRFDFVLKGKVWTAPLDEITSVQIKEPHVVARNLRRLLAVQVNGSEESLFMTHWIDDTVKVIADAVENTGSIHTVSSSTNMEKFIPAPWYARLVTPVIALLALYFFYMGIHYGSIGDFVLAGCGALSSSIDLFARLKHRLHSRIKLPPRP